MTTLAGTQAAMASLLTRRHALPGSTEAEERAAQIAAGNARLSPAEQLEIYREQFWLRHTSCLVDDFAGLGAILGQAQWERLVEEYLLAHPPRSFSLRDLGDRMPEFVERSTWLPHHELCIDMARIEWCYVEVFDAADVSPLDPSTLAAIPEHEWPRARVQLSPALRLLKVRHPVAALRKAIRNHEHPIALPAGEPKSLVVYRGSDRNLYHQELGEAAFAVLEALRDGQGLVAACERAIATYPDAAAEVEASVGAWFRDWAAHAFVVGVSVSDP